jgi:hypothetical protein
MSTAITVTDVSDLGKDFLVTGTIAFGNDTYPASGGLLLTFATGSQSRIPVKTAPRVFQISSKAGFIYELGAAPVDINTMYLQIWTNSAGGSNAALTEHSNASNVAGVQSDTPTFMGIWKKAGS